MIITPCIVSLILLSAAMLGCDRETQPSAPKILVYDNFLYGFSVQYPADWAYEEGVKDTVVIFGSPDLDRDKVRITINITAEDVPESVHPVLADFVEMSEINIQGAVENYNKIDEQDVTVCDLPARIGSYTFSYQGRSLMQSRVYFLDGDVAYTITYTASPNSHQDNYHFLDAMLTSFKCDF